MSIAARRALPTGADQGIAEALAGLVRSIGSEHFPDAYHAAAQALTAVHWRPDLLGAALEQHDRACRAAAGQLDERGLERALLALDCALSAREAEVTAAMMLGETHDEIAARKGLSRGTVVTYRRRAYGKLGIANRRELAQLHRRLLGSRCGIVG